MRAWIRNAHHAGSSFSSRHIVSPRHIWHAENSALQHAPANRKRGAPHGTVGNDLSRLTNASGRRYTSGRRKNVGYGMARKIAMDMGFCRMLWRMEDRRARIAFHGASQTAQFQMGCTSCITATIRPASIQRIYGSARKPTTTATVMQRDAMGRSGRQAPIGRVRGMAIADYPMHRSPRFGCDIHAGTSPKWRSRSNMDAGRPRSAGSFGASSANSEHAP